MKPNPRDREPSLTDQDKPTPENDRPTLDVGWLEVCLAVKNIGKSRDFYQKLGFFPAAGSPEERWIVMESDAAIISLYQDHIDRNILNFRGGDIQQIADALRERGIALKSDVESEPDGSLGCTIEDPDGNIIYFNTHPDELEECECDDETCDCGPEQKHNEGHHHFSSLPSI